MLGLHEILGFCKLILDGIEEVGIPQDNATCIL